ncbi:hypothetical protein ARMGADRAFT_36004 [Armillaria gallica]|uniref:Uncharacterized protein n=1 Tax=Armillaria gallica TaxID=47427 RepID=A0A2H3E8T5_ARMGA|nr:hypothetical protein ARMGADRAFT_36004 [Armillaria gallica]
MVSTSWASEFSLMWNAVERFVDGNPVGWEVVSVAVLNVWKHRLLRPLLAVASEEVLAVGAEDSVIAVEVSVVVVVSVVGVEGALAATVEEAMVVIAVVLAAIVALVVIVEVEAFVEVMEGSEAAGTVTEVGISAAAEADSGAAEGLVLATKVVAASMTSRMGMDLLPAVGMAAPPAAAMDPQAVGTEVVVGIATTSSVAMGRVVTTIEIPKDHGTNPMVICRGISGYLVRHIFCQEVTVYPWVGFCGWCCSFLSLFPIILRKYLHVPAGMYMSVRQVYIW